MTRRKVADAETREKVYQAIITYKQAHDGVAPAFRDIVDMTGVRNFGHIRFLLVQLEEAGRISHVDAKAARSIMVTGGQWIPPSQTQQSS